MIQRFEDGMAIIQLNQSDFPPPDKTTLDLTRFVEYCLRVASRVVSQTWLPDPTKVEIIVDSQAPWPVCDAGSQMLDIRKIRVEQADGNRSLEDLVAIVHPDMVLFFEGEVSIGSMKLIVTGGRGEIKAILVNI